MYFVAQHLLHHKPRVSSQDHDVAMESLHAVVVCHVAMPGTKLKSSLLASVCAGRAQRRQSRRTFNGSCVEIVGACGDSVEATDSAKNPLCKPRLLAPKVHRRPTLDEPGGKLGIDGRYARHELEHRNRRVKDVGTHCPRPCVTRFAFAYRGSAGKQRGAGSFRPRRAPTLGVLCRGRHVALQAARDGEGPPATSVTRTQPLRSRGGQRADSALT